MRSTQPQIGEPIYSLQYFLRNISLIDARIPKIIPDGIYSNQTQEAVYIFQEMYGIVKTGIVDLETWEKIVSVFEDVTKKYHKINFNSMIQYTNLNIKENEQNDVLFPLQSMLLVLSKRFKNLEAVEVSGTHKNDSVTIIKKIQKLAQLPQNGIVDKKMHNIISQLYELYL